MARVLRGQSPADRILMECGVRVHTLRELEIEPSITSILVGGNKVMQYFAEQVKITCHRIHMRHRTEHFGEEASADAIKECIEKCNKDPSCSAIDINLPLPDHLDFLDIASAVDRFKDANCHHPMNIGLMQEGAKFIPEASRATACMQLIRESKTKLSGLNASVISNDITFLSPMVTLLSRANTTVTMAGAKDPNLVKICKGSDILVLCINKPNLIVGSMVKPGSIVIDAGFSYVDGKPIGDVQLRSATKSAKYISTPPGGFEPLQVALTVRNSMHLCMRGRGTKLKRKNKAGKKSVLQEADNK